MSVLASETLQTNISAPPLPVSVSFIPVPEPPYSVFAELFPFIVSEADPPFAFSIMASCAMPNSPSPAENVLARSVSDCELILPK